MEIRQGNYKNDGMFYIELNGEIVAKMTYNWKNNECITIDHTEVGEVLKGQGAGRLMVNKAVAFARENGIKIIPECSFVKGVFSKTPEINDVLSSIDKCDCKKSKNNCC